MNRERAAWTVSVVLLAILAFQLPGSFAQRDEDYAFVRTMVDIHRQVVTNYVVDVDDAALKERAIEGMLSTLDPFSVYIPPQRQEDFDRMLEGTFKGVGIQLDQLPDGRIEVVTPLDGSPAFQAGVMAGDIILKVNGETLDPTMRLPDVIKKIAGQPGSTVRLTVRHSTGEEVELSMERREIIVPTIKGYQRKKDDSWDYWVCDNPKIAYVRITQFTPDTFQNLKDVLIGTASSPGVLDQGMKGFVLDLRFNPGGRLDQAVQVVDMFVKQGTIVSTKGRNRPEQIFSASGTSTLPYFPMIVLVNEHSASAAEIVSGSLLDNKRALVMGQRTYGKGSVQELIPLDGNGGELKLTVAYYYLPSGRCVHRLKDAKEWGVEPQIIVPMDDATERDVLMQHFAQETIRKPIPKPSTRGVTSTEPAATTQPVDNQLQQAINTMVGLIVLDNSKSSEPAQPVTAPSTQPTSVPTTQAAGR